MIIKSVIFDSKIPDTTNLVTPALTVVWDKIPNVSNAVKKADSDVKIPENKKHNFYYF